MSTDKKPLLPSATLALSIVMLLAGLVECAGVFLFGTKIPYDSNIVPLLALGHVGLSLITVIVALIAVIKHRQWQTVAAMIMATMGIIVAILGLVLLFGVMLANHPI